MPPHIDPALLADLRAYRPTAWVNADRRPVDAVLPTLDIQRTDIDDADARLRRFAPFLAAVFPQTAAAKGIIESPLHKVRDPDGRVFLKLDSHLPVSGSVKARGGIYEVLVFAEEIARVAVAAGQAPGLPDNYADFATPLWRAIFGQYGLAVGSTGNLGLSVGIAGAALGLRTQVHMSADARPWKKNLLRSRGVDVVEHAGDYSVAVAAGRAAADADPRIHFVDDESSRHLFLGYAVGARRLARQLADAGVEVDHAHPLAVYLPCGVGGAPGGITFGLRTEFGDDVIAIWVEPTHAPAMLLGLASGEHDRISVADIGLDGRTAADGLAVGRPSRFVGARVGPLVDAIVTVDDDALYRALPRLAEGQGVEVEPSAAAGVVGMEAVLQPGAVPNVALERRLARATHVAWTTGGSMVPPEEMDAYLARGRALAGPASHPTQTGSA